MTSSFRALVIAAVLGASAGGCATARAKSAADAPPLDVPPPPLRTVEPLEAETPTPVPLVEEPARRTPPRPAPPPRRDQPRQEAPKPEPPKTEPPPEPARPVEEAPRPATPLQTAPPQAEVEAEQRIRGVLAKAKSDLARINVRSLSTDARQQYTTAERFVTQAEEALRQKNMVFARSVAQKAADLAAQLAGK
jgi:outer membrane biosynthesis protein TonB